VTVDTSAVLGVPANAAIGLAEYQKLDWKIEGSVPEEFHEPLEANAGVAIADATKAKAAIEESNFRISILLKFEFAVSLRRACIVTCGCNC
jgi:hypothetical protein